MSISVIWGRKHQLSAGSCLAHSCHAWILMAVSMSQKSQNLQKNAVAQNYNENICEFHEFHRNAKFGSCPNALNISAWSPFVHEASVTAPGVSYLISAATFAPWSGTAYCQNLGYRYLGLHTCNQIQRDPARGGNGPRGCKSSCTFHANDGEGVPSGQHALCGEVPEGFWMFLETIIWWYLMFLVKT